MSNNQEKSIQDLIAEREAIDKQIEQKQKEGKAKAIKDIKDMMDQYGITLSDLDGSPKKGKKNIGVSVVKYQMGDNTWSGRGPKPKWFKDAVANGDNMDQYLVNRSGSDRESQSES